MDPERHMDCEHFLVFDRYFQAEVANSFWLVNLNKQSHLLIHNNLSQMTIKRSQKEQN